MVEKTRADVIAQLTATGQPFELVPGKYLAATVYASKTRPPHCARCLLMHAVMRHLLFTTTSA